jgi:multisubunit Na+/H+ antiporter MnhB subunit
MRPMADRTGAAARVAAALAIVPLGAVLARAVLTLPTEPAALVGEVEAAMGGSGVSHPVTAVLLNFRGYDTWLELGVLLTAALALLAVRRTGDVRDAAAPAAVEPVLDGVARLLVPLMVLVAGYLLWLGSHSPGGAFQAGAVLGAAAVLGLLAGQRSVTALGALPLRLALTAGLLAFLAAGAAAAAAGGHFLEHPPARAGAVILAIEAAATLSIGVTLAVLFAGARVPAGSAEARR